MKEYFQRLFAFNQWANEAVMTFLQENDIQDARILRIASHIANAERNWYYRSVHQQQDVTVWNVYKIEEIISSLKASDIKWVQYLKRVSEQDLSLQLDYRNFAGEPNLSILLDVLAHVVNHSTYHRGQIIYLIREMGITPPGTDYIRFARLG